MGSVRTDFDTLTVSVPLPEGESFTLVTSRDGGMPTLVFDGTADFAAKEALMAALERAHNSLVFEGAEVVTVDLRSLDFMSSSCFKAMLTWLRRVSQTSIRQYRVRMVHDPACYWQRRGAAALQGFAPSLVSIHDRAGDTLPPQF